MKLSEVIDVARYARKYSLHSEILGLYEVSEDLIDINQPGLIMHGSEADPLTILKYGLAPQRTKKNELESDWQVCLGISSKEPNTTLAKSLSMKNPAVKYAGNFSTEGIIYVLSVNVKNTPGYKEFWESEQQRGYAWVPQAIVADQITALITENIPLAAAATLAAKTQKPIYKPNGNCYIAKDITE